MNKILKIAAGCALSLYLALNFATTAYALDSLSPIPTDYLPLTTVPGAFKAGVATNPVKVIAGIYGLAIGIGSLIAVVMIMYAGFEYMYGESISGKSDAKARIINAFLGLFVILGSYIILKTINPALVNFDVTLQAGTGKLSGLIAVQKELDAYQAKVTQANAATAQRLQQLDQLKNTSSEKDALIASTQARLDEALKQPKSVANDAVIKNLQGQIAAIRSDKQAILDQIDVRTLENYSAIAANNAGLASDKLFAEKIVELKKVTNLADASVAAKNSLTAVSNHTDSRRNTIASNMLAAEALKVTGDTSAARDAYLATARQDMIYLNESKAFVDSALNITASSEFDRLISSNNLNITVLESMGRKDLAEQLKKDMNNTTKLMKVSWGSSCAGGGPIARQEWSLCKP